MFGQKAFVYGMFGVINKSLCDNYQIVGLIKIINII